MPLKCDMTKDCSAAVTHLDRKGYVYCAPHGVDRRGAQPCRKLQPWELRRLEQGRPLARY
jgi:hypothetical protein